MAAHGARPSVVADSLILRGSAAWAPDGRVDHRRGAARRRTTAHDFSPGDGPPVPLVGGYSVDPVWSPDGEFLPYTGAVRGDSAAAHRRSRGQAVPTAARNARDVRSVVFGSAAGTIVVLRGEFTHKDFWLIDLKPAPSGV